MPDQWTVGRLLQWTTQYLADRGAETARLDAEVLLAEARGCRRIELYTAFDETPSDEVRAAFRELVRRRAEGTPVAYLVGRREFYSLMFRVTPDVLIPRPETEFLVIAALDLMKAPSSAGNPISVADVGTGSGCIALALAKQTPNCRVTAIDINPAALAVARANSVALGLSERVEFLQGDLLGVLPAETKFDIIASNPPYVTTAEMAALPKDVREHEPRVALEAGPRGIEVIERLVPQAAERLRPGGHVLIEISPMLEKTAREVLAAEPRLEIGPTIKDLAGLARVVQARRRN